MTAAPPATPDLNDADIRPDAEEDLAVSIRNLNFFYGSGDIRKQVLFDINLDLPRGQIVIMTGPSGSGKTTLLTLVGGLRTLQEGSLQVEGHELVGLNTNQLVEVRRNIGFIFQAHNLFESLSAVQNVAMAIELHDNRSKRDRAVEILSQLGLGERVDYRPKSLSGGQKQRVAIARALVNKPRLILADEPTAALDKDSGREVVNLMQKLTKEQNCTILMVTHDNRILDVADRIVNLIDGNLVSDRSFDDYIALHSPKSLDPTMFIM
ncbi:MAG: DevA family ABC transporter ATP-binding protein [Cyanobacteria bacterium J06639_1]